MMSIRSWTGRVLRLLGRVVPGDRRDEWLREWDAELGQLAAGAVGQAHRPDRPPGRLAAAAEDALRLRLRRLGRRSPTAGLRELRVAARALARSPSFTAAVVLTLGLGIGANAAMFTVINAVLLQPLPYPEADRLVRIGTVWLPEGNESSTVSTADFDDLAVRLRTVEDLSLRAGWNVTYQADEPIRLEIAGVSSGFFRHFGRAPHMGRYLLREEDEPGHQPAAVLSYGLWQRVFGGDGRVVGRTLTFDGQPYVVVGVAEPELREPAADVEIWTSRPSWIDGAARDQPWLQVFGRLASGATLEDARAELAAISRDLAREHPDTNTDHAFTAASLREDLTGPVRPALLVLAAVAGLVLVVTCANVANLILVRSAGRGREMAVRISLGAGRARLAGQLLAEGLLLALLGGAGGLALAALATRALVALGAPGLPRLASVQVDDAVLLFTILVSATTGVLFGLAPLLQVSGASPARGLRESGRCGEGRRVRRVRRALVAAELAASAVLLVASGLLLRSLDHLTRVETGVQPEGVLVFRVSPPQAAYPAPADLRAFYEGVRSGIARLPDVEAVGGVSVLPFTFPRMYEFTRDDRPSPRPGEETLAELRAFEPGYFRSLGIPLVEGRLLDERDSGGAPPAILVDEEMARRFFPVEDPVGERITIRWGQMAPIDRVSYEVVGVVGDVRHQGPAAPPTPTLYLLRGHDSTPYWENGSFVAGFTITVRTSGDPLALAGAAAQVVWDLDRTVPITEVGPLERLLWEHRVGPRHQAMLIGAFALLATALASVGLAGVVAYAVAERGHELGVRQALGADAGDVVRLVLGEGVRLVAMGVPVGLLLAAAGSRLLRSLLFGVEPLDPLTYAAVGLGLAAIALLAAWIPARRAAGIHPAKALRAEA